MLIYMYFSAFPPTSLSRALTTPRNTWAGPVMTRCLSPRRLWCWGCRYEMLPSRCHWTRRCTRTVRPSRGLHLQTFIKEGKMSTQLACLSILLHVVVWRWSRPHFINGTTELRKLEKKKSSFAHFTSDLVSELSNSRSRRLSISAG